MIIRRDAGAAPNSVAAPYRTDCSPEKNWRFYVDFCRYHGLKFYDFEAWLDLEKQK